jgi:ubiquinone/menaquinone biosynthesis C-methylase UbiE
MYTFLIILFGFFFLILLIYFGTRLISDRRSIPCPSWLSWMVEADNPVFRNDSARVILSHLNIQAGMRVLDYGCGPGRLALPLARQVGPQGQVTALDLQSEMLAKVRAKAQAENLTNIEYVQASAGDTHLKADSYDAALLVTVLGELPDPMRALGEIHACLKPGGLLSITEVIADPHFQKREKVRGLAKAAGFIETAAFGGRWSYTLHFQKP